MPTVRSSLAFVLLAAATLNAQSLVANSAFDGSTSPFIPTEMVTFSLSGLEAFRPFTIFTGTPIAPITVVGFDNFLAVHPASVQPFGPFDGLGVFGGGLPFYTDANGSFSFSARVPLALAALPYSFTIQAVALQNPVNSPASALFEFTNATTITIDEPTSSPVITSVAPHVVQEGAMAPIILSGTGFLAESTVVPTVRFTSICSPISTALATSVSVIDIDRGPGFVAALRVVPPPFLGAPTMPPMSGGGAVTILVDYTTSGLYPNTPALAMGSTLPPTAFNDLTYLALQSSTVPVITGITPNTNTVAGGCQITINGSGFLQCASVVFDVGGPGQALGQNVNVVSDSQLTVDPPPHSAGQVGVAVRNIDHFPTSPRQSLPSPGITEFSYLAFSVSSIVVTAVTPNFVLEGAGGLATISGTCPLVGSINTISPQAGVVQVNVGSALNGVDAFVAASVVSITNPTPGTFSIDVNVPAFPPGLNPLGMTALGRGNAGKKAFQIIAPPCLNPGLSPHKTFTQIAASEANNVFYYRTVSAPTITSLEPNNCIRRDGGQTLSILGTGFFTNDTTLPSSLTTLGPTAEMLSNLFPTTAFTNIVLVSDTMITVSTIDLTGALVGATYPVLIDAQVTNPDTQLTATAGTVGDLYVFPSLAGLIANTFSVAGGSLTVDTGTSLTPQVFTFTNDLVIPSGFTLNAQGDAPLIIRCRGNVTIDGVIDLSGVTITSAPYFRPAAAGRGGLGSNAMNLGLQDPFQGLFGTSPYDPITMMNYPTAGFGGSHSVPNGAGGGGGGMATMGANGQMGSGLSGSGGSSSGFASLPFPVLGSAIQAENFLPPGGGGGGAGGMGTPPPFNPSAPPMPPDMVGFAGGGGNAGGGLIIIADGVITVNGTLRADGQTGANGAVATVPPNSGGGGGGGAGGAIALQALQRILIGPTAVFSAQGGAGGVGGTLGINDGGTGSFGMIRCAIPLVSANPTSALMIDPLATLQPTADTTGYSP